LYRNRLIELRIWARSREDATPGAADAPLRGCRRVRTARDPGLYAVDLTPASRCVGRPALRADRRGSPLIELTYLGSADERQSVRAAAYSARRRTGPASTPDGPGGEGAGPVPGVLLQTKDLDWVDKTLAVCRTKLWRDDVTGASIALVRFQPGTGIPSRHAHASNQFMFCCGAATRMCRPG